MIGCKNQYTCTLLVDVPTRDVTLVNGVSFTQIRSTVAGLHRYWRFYTAGRVGPLAGRVGPLYLVTQADFSVSAVLSKWTSEF